jgi:hypothetical protein
LGYPVHKTKYYSQRSLSEPLSTDLFIDNYLHDVSIVSSKKRSESDRANPTHPRWIPPQPGCVKLNMDTAMEKSTTGGNEG